MANIDVTDAGDNFEIGGVCKGRSPTECEDRKIMPVNRRISEYPHEPFLIGVLDGMSNPVGGGRFASEFAVNAIRTGFFTEGKNIEEILRETNAELIRRASEEGLYGAGTTIALAEVNPDTGEAVWYSAGDSAIYLCRQSEERRAANKPKLDYLESSIRQRNADYEKVKKACHDVPKNEAILSEKIKELEGIIVAHQTDPQKQEFIKAKKQMEAQKNRLSKYLETLEQERDRLVERIEEKRAECDRIADDVYAAKLINPLESDERGRLFNYVGFEGFSLRKGIFKLNQGDYLVIATDGVYKSYSPEGIAEAVGIQRGVRDICLKLVNGATGNDDKSVVVLKWS